MFTRNRVIMSHNIKTPLTSISRAVGNILQLKDDQLIKSLFANNEQGFFYDPNDLSTMFQNSAGTIPVTAAGQPVGLMLDKSKGLLLGSEKNPNTSFSTNLYGWTVGGASSATVENGEARVAFGGAIGSSLNNWFSLNGVYSVGNVYTVSFDATYVSGGNLQAGFGYTACTTVFATENLGIKQRYTFTAAGSLNTQTALLAFAASSVGSVWKIDNVSVKEVLGNHAYQTTSSARPILRDAPRRIDFDAVDDKLITNLPAQLTGCTVIRSVPNVGTQILTGQTIPTIPTTYNDNTDHCGLLVINRALTTSETSAITSEFNKRAGV